MLSLRRDRAGRDGEGQGRRRPGPALAVSLAVNAAVLAIFFHAATRGLSWTELLDLDRERLTSERIGFVRVPPPTPETPPTPGRAGGDGRPVTRDPAPSSAPEIVAPSTIPSEIPPPAAEAPRTGGGTGPVIGGGGPTVGIRPNFTDPRLWDRPGPNASAPKTAKERIDSVIADRLGPVRDSIARAQALAAGQRGPGDWTLDGPGGKWGMDQSSIHLGKVKIPNAVLALLGEQFQRNLRGNPIEIERERRLALIRQDIQDHAQSGMVSDEFSSAVKRIRERKDRERAEKVAEQESRRRPATQAVQP